MSNFKKLSRTEMKSVLGGKVAACGAGETAYSCTPHLDNGNSVTGAVCATSSSGASSSQIATWRSQGTWGGDGFTSVSCN